MHGYDGYYGLDINPERMPVDVALKISMDAVRAACDRVNNLDHELIVSAAEEPAQHRGTREAYMVRARASRYTQLPPLADALTTVT